MCGCMDGIIHTMYRVIALASNQMYGGKRRSTMMLWRGGVGGAILFPSAKGRELAVVPARGYGGGD